MLLLLQLSPRDSNRVQSLLMIELGLTSAAPGYFTLMYRRHLSFFTRTTQASRPHCAPALSHPALGPGRRTFPGTVTRPAVAHSGTGRTELLRNNQLIVTSQTRPTSLARQTLETREITQYRVPTEWIVGNEVMIRDITPLAMPRKILTTSAVMLQEAHIIRLL